MRLSTNQKVARHMLMLMLDNESQLQWANEYKMLLLSMLVRVLLYITLLEGTENNFFSEEALVALCIRNLKESSKL
jgi:hypothetical protein